MNFARESYNAELMDEMTPLWEEHHQEIASYPEIELNPNLGLYEASDRLGTLRIFTARQDTILVGYQVFFVSPHPHTMHSIQAMQDILYLEKQYRRGYTGYKFVKWCVEELKKEQIDCIFQHISSEHDFGRMLVRLGFEHVDQVYGLRLRR